jgi:hypothetical protein
VTAVRVLLEYAHRFLHLLFVGIDEAGVSPSTEYRLRVDDLDALICRIRHEQDREAARLGQGPKWEREMERLAATGDEAA